jgi:hypothetical protein
LAIRRSLAGSTGWADLRLTMPAIPHIESFFLGFQPTAVSSQAVFFAEC